MSNQPVNPLTTNVSVVICKDAPDAIYQGYLYREPVFKPIELEKVVVVQGGMESGRSSVDFILCAPDGQKYVFVMSGALLKSIPC